MSYLLSALQDAFFLERTDSVSAQCHRDLLAIDFKGFLLQVRLKYALGAA